MSIGKYLVERKYLGRRKDVSEVEGVGSKAREGTALEKESRIMLTVQEKAEE